MADAPRIATESIGGRRPYQEDSVLADVLPDGRTLVAIADGMGGHAAGEVASALALETLVEALNDGMTLEHSFILANERVNTKSREPGKQGMGTTLVAALLDGDSYQVANVGDSRLYRITREGIEQVTDDHSFVSEAEKRGEELSPELIQRFKDALTRSIGIDPSVKVDVFGPFPVERGVALMLCSDGMYKVLDDDVVHEVFLQSGGPKGAAQSLVATAYDNMSDDNITVAVAEFGEVQRHRAAGTVPIEFEPPPPAASPAPAAAPAPAATPAGQRAPGVGAAPSGSVGAAVSAGSPATPAGPTTEGGDSVSPESGSGMSVGMSIGVLIAIGALIVVVIMAVRLSLG